MSGLARTAGAVYTRYADDLAFSGGEGIPSPGQTILVTRWPQLRSKKASVVNHHKTRIMRQGVRQQLAGSCGEPARSSLAGADLELPLEAILTNCARFSVPASQNRDALPDFRAHLEGRIGFVEMVNAEQGQRLRELFEAITWEGA